MTQSASDRFSDALPALYNKESTLGKVKKIIRGQPSRRANAR